MTGTEIARFNLSRKASPAVATVKKLLDRAARQEKALIALKDSFRTVAYDEATFDSVISLQEKLFRNWDLLRAKTEAYSETLEAISQAEYLSEIFDTALRHYAAERVNRYRGWLNTKRSVKI